MRGSFAGVMTSGVLMRVQNALGLDMTGGAVFTDEMGAALDAWLGERGAAPTTKAAIIAATAPLKDVTDDAGLKLTDANLNDLADAYMRYKGLPLDPGVYGSSSWFAKNWMWLAGGVVLLAGAGVGGYFWYKKTQEKKGALGELEEGGDGGMGCGCALGHSGRTSMYSFPTGRKRGHYRDSTGRFHKHS